MSAASLRIGIVCSRYHATITDRLRDGAIDAFLSAGGSRSSLLIVPTPGSWELVAASASLCSPSLDDAADIEAIVALGCILTGETIHDQVIAAAVANGLMSLTVQTRMPITLGVLTCRTMEQAAERAGGTHGNKGAEAMLAAIELAAGIRARAAGECVHE